jgi:hypothetical protein
VQVRLNETHCLNQGLCELPSCLWYAGDLRRVASIARARLAVPAVQHPDLVDAILVPAHPVTLVLVEHRTDHQQLAV